MTETTGTLSLLAVNRALIFFFKSNFFLKKNNSAKKNDRNNTHFFSAVIYCYQLDLNLEEKPIFR